MIAPVPNVEALVVVLTQALAVHGKFPFPKLIVGIVKLSVVPLKLNVLLAAYVSAPIVIVLPPVRSVNAVVALLAPYGPTNGAVKLLEEVTNTCGFLYRINPLDGVKQ